MERLFSKCTRSRDISESQGDIDPPVWLQEINLDVSTEEFLSAEKGFTYADLYAKLRNRNTIAWLTPHAAITRHCRKRAYSWGQLDDSYRLCFNVDGKDIVAMAQSSEALSEICDIVLRLLAASVVHTVVLCKKRPHDIAWISAPILGNLMEQCQSLKILSLKDLEMDENHCRALGAHSKPGLEILLLRCKLTNAGTRALVEMLGRNEGPTGLAYCDVDSFVLANVLRGNSRLKSLTPRDSNSPDDGNRQVLATAGALKENKGLIDLDLSYGLRVSDETWGAICKSLETHPTLEVLNLRAAYNDAWTAPAAIACRIHALLGMMKMNTSIHTIRLHNRYTEHELFRTSVLPYLETNRLRPRLLALQRARPIGYRTNVLGRALLSARTNPNMFWMLLSGNADVAIPSRTTTIAVAAKLPGPAAATSTAKVATVTASVMSTLTTTANVAIPSARQKRNSARLKRKAHP
jgi:hypothetical protein